MREVVEIKTTTEWPAGAWEEHGEAGRHSSEGSLMRWRCPREDGGMRRGCCSPSEAQQVFPSFSGFRLSTGCCLWSLFLLPLGSVALPGHLWHQMLGTKCCLHAPCTSPVPGLPPLLWFCAG